MKSVTIAGAGFSGLTLAYYLVKRGMKVEIYDLNPSPGGLIGTKQTPFGLVETAANGILAGPQVLQMWRELNLTPARNNPQRRKRYIYWRRPRRWPLPLFSTLKLTVFIFKKVFLPWTVKPLPLETVRDWAHRQVDAAFAERLLGPALQGIYAGDPARLSARLVLSRFLTGGTKGKTSAPEGGMGAWIQALVAELEKSGAVIHRGRRFELTGGLAGPTVLATDAASVAGILAPVKPQLAAQLSKVETLPLISLTVFFDPHEKDLRGFGCLFPRSQGFRALGVLFNASIYEGRSTLRSETWILGGADGRALFQLSDDELLHVVLKDRRLLTGREEHFPTGVVISRWPRALPHYTVDWETVLQNLDPQPPLFLHGNYLGQLGLSAILERSENLATELSTRYGR